jgi:KaiC/GvpD/RAD55 family RecA-like ATPase
MAVYKSESLEDERIFISTQAYLKLYNTFKQLKKEKGRFIQVIGSPGTGKSTNIYHALANLDLNVYQPILLLDSLDGSSREVFREVFNVFKKDFKVNTYKDVYRKASQYDAILLADKLLDSEYLDQNKVGLSKWIENRGIKSFYLYLLFIFEYLKHMKDLKKINVILHLSPVVLIKGKKIDLLTDLSMLSKVLKTLLGFFFELVEINYDESETIEIVSNHPHYKNEKQVKTFIQRYGNRPRLICQALEENPKSKKIKNKRIDHI